MTLPDDESNHKQSADAAHQPRPPAAVEQEALDDEGARESSAGAKEQPAVSKPLFKQPERWETAMIERIMVPGVMAPVSHYCHVVRAGPLVWVSGIVGMDGTGNVPEGTVEQFDLAMDVMDQCLKAAGAGPEHVVKVQVFMTDISERASINPRRSAYFGEHRPASTLVEVTALVDPRLKVEIECQAYLGEGDD